MLLLARLPLFETFACIVCFMSCRLAESVNQGIPQPPIENVQIQVGMVVKRGRDWQYGDQDGMKADGKPALFLNRFQKFKRRLVCLSKKWLVLLYDCFCGVRSFYWAWCNPFNLPEDQGFSR